jgi:hypothetical protein
MRISQRSDARRGPGSSPVTRIVLCMAVLVATFLSTGRTASASCSYDAICHAVQAGSENVGVPESAFAVGFKGPPGLTPPASVAARKVARDSAYTYDARSHSRGDLQFSTANRGELSQVNEHSAGSVERSSVARHRSTTSPVSVVATESEYVNLASEGRTSHILDGEVRPNGTYGGGHRPGTGFPNKSEFPAGWSDDQIMHNISDVATDPALPWTPGDRSGDFLVNGTRSNVDIEVLIRNDQIWTGYPTNLPRNPR